MTVLRSPARPIRVGLVDDHALVREGLRLVLDGADGIAVVGEAATLAETLELADGARPDVLLLDVTLADDDGIQVLRSVKARHPGMHVIVVTMHRSSETVRQALAAGASGYLVKGAQARDLVEAVRAVWRGERYLHSSVTGAIVDDSIRWQQAGSGLSAREREILGLVASGHPPAEVASRLGISIHTFRRHIANLSDKLELHGMSQLVRYAIVHGLAREDEPPRDG